MGELPPARRRLQLALGHAADEVEEGAWCGAFGIERETGEAECVVALPVPPRARDARANAAAARRASLPLKEQGLAGADGAEPPLLVAVSVEACGASLLVCLDVSAVAPYVLLNQTSEAYSVQQEGVALRRLLPAHGKLALTWDEPALPRVLLLSSLGRAGPIVTRRLLPDVLSEPQAHGAPPELYTWVRLGEASRTVLLSPRYPAQAEQAGELAGLQLIVELGGIGLSLVDTARRHELAYLRLERAALLAVSSQLEIEVELTVDALQLDQQLPGACYPVALQGLGGSAASVAAVAEDAPWLQLRLSRRRQEKRLRAVELRLGELRLHLEEALLAALHAFAQRAVPPTATAPATAPAAPPAAPAAPAAPASPARDDGAVVPSPLMATLAEPPLPTAARKRPWYIDEVQLCALRLQVSYP